MKSWGTRRQSGFAVVVALAFLLACGGGNSVNGGSGGGGNGGSGGGSSNHSVSLKWNASASNNVVGYNVYRGSNSGSYSLLVSMNSTTTYTDTTAQSGSTYSYVVTAVSSGNAESGRSNVAQVSIP